MSSLMQKLVELIRLEPLGDDVFRGESRKTVGPRVFGGQVLGQALFAATRTVEGRTAHSLQAYFLAAGDATAPITYQVERVRDGGSFSTRRVVATQHGRRLFDLAASFQVPAQGLEHQSPMPEVIEPERLSGEREVTARFLEQEDVSENFRTALLRPQPIEFRPVAPDHPLRPDKKTTAREVWMRAPEPLPDEPALHQALLAYASDRGLLGSALRAHGLGFLSRGLQVASLDHGMWFHRPFRFDDWLLYTMESPTATGERGFTRGQIFSRDGSLVASVVQEGLMRLHPTQE